MNEITEPDFYQWALNLRTMGITTDIEAALKLAYEQGYQLGLNKGWALEQDKHNA